MWLAATGELAFLGAEDRVLAVAIGAQRRLRNAVGESLAVDAGAILLHHLGVAHVAGIGNRGAECLRLRTQQLVRAAVAEGAIGRAGVALLDGLAVHALFVIRGLIRVAAGAGRLGHAFRMGVLVVLDVAGSARHRGVRALCHLLPLLVAGRAIRLAVHGGRPYQDLEKEQKSACHRLVRHVVGSVQPALIDE